MIVIKPILIRVRVSSSPMDNSQYVNEAATILIGGHSARKFRAHFGISVEATCYMWTSIALQSWTLPVDITHLLWALLFLKCYPTMDVASGFCKVDSKTYIKYVDYMIYCVLPFVLAPVSPISSSRL